MLLRLLLKISLENKVACQPALFSFIILPFRHFPRIGYNKKSHRLGTRRKGGGRGWGSSAKIINNLNGNSNPGSLSATANGHERWGQGKEKTGKKKNKEQGRSGGVKTRIFVTNFWPKSKGKFIIYFGANFTSEVRDAGCGQGSKPVADSWSRSDYARTTRTLCTGSQYILWCSQLRQVWANTKKKLNLFFHAPIITKRRVIKFIEKWEQ